MKRLKMKNRKISVGLSVVIAQIGAVVVSLLGAVLLTVLILNGSIGEESAGMLMIGVWLAASMVSGFIGGFAGEGRNPLGALIAAGVYLALLLACNFLFWGQGIGMFWLAMAAVAAGAALPVYMCLKGQGRGIRKMKRRFR